MPFGSEFSDICAIFFPSQRFEATACRLRAHRLCLFIRLFGCLPLVSMFDNVRITRANARSFAQISLDRSMSETLGQELFDVRRIARAFRTAAKSVNVGLDITDIKNIRRENGEVVILVKNTAQHAKLRQMLPRLKMALEEAGFRDPITLRIKPPTPSIQLRENLALGAPRVASVKSVELIRKKAESMKPSALKDALASLAKTLEKANRED